MSVRTRVGRQCYLCPRLLTTRRTMATRTAYAAGQRGIAGASSLDQTHIVSGRSPAVSSRARCATAHPAPSSCRPAHTHPG